MFNRSNQTNKTPKGAGVHKNDTRPFSVWDVPLALVLLTRLPLPRLPEDGFERQAQAVWAFPLAGLVIGGLACLAGWLAILANLPLLACAAIVVAILIVTTGAMHEDGLADTFDGLWGGYSTERRLEIMKDSHIGTYGVLALMVTQFIRVVTISALLATGAFLAIVAACVFSRALMPVLMALLPNARNTGLSHAVGIPSRLPVAMGLGIAVLIAALMTGSHAILPILCAVGIGVILAMIARGKIGGQTGDILGAAQQLSELAFLLALTAQV